MTHTIENIMKNTMEQLTELTDVSTVIGEPVISSDGTMVLPVSKVTLGFMSGGGEYGSRTPTKKSGSEMDSDTARYPFAGTSVVGMSMTPMGFISVGGGAVRMIPMRYNDALERAVDLLPQAISCIGHMKTEKSESKQ